MLQSRSQFELAIDVGTATTRLHLRDRLSPLARPSTTWRGSAAQPALRGGVVTDGDAAAAVVGELFRSLPRMRMRRPRVLACVPTDATVEERARLVESVLRAGAGAVEVIPEPLAAAIGAGLETDLPRAQLLVDVGEGVTDCAVVREGVLVATGAQRVAVADLRATATKWIEANLGVRISAVEAERVLREVGVGPIVRAHRPVLVVGRPLAGIGPIRATCEADALHAALEPVVETIVGRIGRFFAELPSALAEEVRESGLCLTGGGALLTGLLERIVAETETAVWRAPAPLQAVIDGARQIVASGRPSSPWT
ncbi:MAG: rod shape-determining protein [Myxococcota bacterium]